MNEKARSLPRDVAVTVLEDGSVGIRTIEASEETEFKPSIEVLDIELHRRKKQAEFRRDLAARAAGIGLTAAKGGGAWLGIDFLAFLEYRGNHAIVPIPTTVAIAGILIAAGVYVHDVATHIKGEKVTELERLSEQISKVTEAQSKAPKKFRLLWTEEDGSESAGLPVK